MITIGVDLGGTHVRSALVDDAGTVLRRDRRDTPHGDHEPDIVVAMVREMMAAAEAGDGAWADADGVRMDEVRGVVIGVPGVVDYTEEALLRAPNLPPSWAPCLRESWFGRHLDLPIAMANDADLAAVGEATFGAGRGVPDVVFVTISTGVGAGTVLGGRLVHGRYSSSEVGHTVIDRIRAGSGGFATVEELGSGTALARLAADAGLTVEGADLARLAEQGLAAIEQGAEATTEAERAELRAAAVWVEALDAAALGIVNLCWAMAPQLVVVGGGVGMNAELVLPFVRRALLNHGPSFLDVQVTSAALGDDAGLSGSAAWWQAVGRHG